MANEGLGAWITQKSYCRKILHWLEQNERQITAWGHGSVRKGSTWLQQRDIALAGANERQWKAWRMDQSERVRSAAATGYCFGWSKRNARLLEMWLWISQKGLRGNEQ
jgi:hypothetical protein